MWIYFIGVGVILKVHCDAPIFCIDHTNSLLARVSDTTIDGRNIQTPSGTTPSPPKFNVNVT